MLLTFDACTEVHTNTEKTDGTEPFSEINTESNQSDTEATEATTHKDDKNDKDVLVIVFSATGTTKGVAEKIAVITGGDMREIIPTVPYTSADLNYGNSNSRATREQNDSSARPEISENISVDGYKTIYIGYPIWWGQAPRIMSTFVESHDFSGMTVIPFCTSGSSDIGQSDDVLANQAGTGNWLQGKRFSGSVTEEQLQKWINETGEQYMEKTLHLYINDYEVPVSWENNASVDELKKLAEDNLDIQMSMYGGFEQVGPLGTSITRNDKQTTTEFGDIVLYSGDQIVVFYGSNSWSYTRLGKIIGKTASDLEDLLGKGDVILTLSYR